MRTDKGLEEEKKQLNGEIEDLKETIRKMPGGMWAVITGAVISALCSILTLAGFWYGFVGLLVISALAYLAGDGAINEPVVVSIVSVAFGTFPFFLLLFLLLGLFIWAISTVILLLL